MESDAEGFLYPVVDASACLNCYLCERICPVHQSESITYEVLKDTSDACALICSDPVLHQAVGSGGAFSLMARRVLGAGGVVIGAAWTPDWLVEHVAVETWEEYACLCGTKYMQSNPGNTLQQTRDFLKTGRLVLFCGTGCQVAGLVSFLRKDYPNLVTVNIACYGAPSPGVWQRYLHDLQNKYQLGTIESVQFRKKEGNSSLNMEVVGSRNTYRNYVYGDPYGWGLVNDVINRPSCENCLFKGAAARCDITVGDAWGIESFDPAANPHLGISVVVAHSSKGVELVDSLQGDCSYFRKLPLPGAIEQNMGIICATNTHAGWRRTFFEHFSRGVSPMKTLQKLQRGSLWKRCINHGWFLMRQLKKLARKLLRR